MAAALQDHVLVCGRAAETLRDGFISCTGLIEHISGWEGGARDHEEWTTESTQNFLIGATSDGQVANCMVARTMQTLAIYRCRPVRGKGLRERSGSFDEKNLYRSSGQRKKYNSMGATKYWRIH